MGPLLFLAATLCWVDFEEVSRVITATNSVAVSETQGKRANGIGEKHSKKRSQNSTASSRRNSEQKPTNAGNHTASRAFEADKKTISNEVLQPRLDHFIDDAGNTGDSNKASSLALTDLPTPAPQNDETTEPLYLEHASHGGWSNQVQCIQHAYFMAKATGRTLVASPVLPHWNPVGSGIWNGSRFLHRRAISSNFNLNFPLQDTYLSKKQPYIPISQVLDLEYTFPNVTTVDYRDFRERYYHPPTGRKTNLTHWVLESQYHHDNTIWTIENTGPDQMATMAPIRYNETDVLKRRDVSSIHPTNIGQNASSTTPHQLWTYLDTFYPKMDQRFRPVLAKEMPIRYSLEIRQAAKEIHKKVWNHTLYSAIHLRVGDGFAGKAKATITNVLKEHTEQTAEWIQAHKKGIKKLFELGLFNKIGIFVATDMNSQERIEFLKRLRQSLHTMATQQNHSHLIFEAFYSDSFSNYTSNLKASLGYPEIFLDQQLAACSPIVYTASVGSSFSRLIQSIRNSPGACDV